MVVNALTRGITTSIDNPGRMLRSPEAASVFPSRRASFSRERTFSTSSSSSDPC